MFPSSWKLSASCQVFKIVDEHLSPLHYCPPPSPSLVSLGNSFDFIMNKHIVDHLTRNIPGNKHNGFCSSRSTVDVLTAISHRFSETYDVSFHTRAFVLTRCSTVDYCIKFTNKVYEIIKCLSFRSIHEGYCE